MEHLNTQHQAQVVEAPQEEKVVKGKNIIDLLGVEEYKAFMREFRVKLAELVQEGLMSEEVGTRILNEFSYNTFNQVVRINANM